jgi:WD40 repeat protein
MPEPLVCPDVQQFERLRRGEMSLAEVEQLAQHIEQCRLCAERVQAAAMDDPLMQTFRTLPTAIEPADRARVAELMDRLKSLPLACPLETAATASSATPSGDAAAGEFVLNVPVSDIVLSPPQAPDEIGRLGGYRVLKMLGAGGMGMVYQAEDVRLQRPVALKVMKAALAKNPDSRERFLREARAAAKVKSDHVVTIYQVGEDRQIVFLAMEYLEGMSLAEWLDKGRKPTLVQAARMGRQIALGLSAAHERGLIHRDIKPGNIWLESNHQGRVKLLDFGLARGTADEIQLTQTGALIGTPAFMAPEQARGAKVDQRCDLFSLGVVLYRLTTGQMPFRGDNTMSLLTALALETPKPPREINPALSPRMAALIERLLSKDREQRPKTAKDVAEELAAIEREATQSATDEQTVKLEAANRQRKLPGGGFTRQLTLPVRRWLVAASLLLLLGGAVAAIVVIIRDKQGNPIAKIDVPEGGSVEIKDVGQPKEDGKKPPVVEEKIPLAAAPLPPLPPNTPLSPTALVQQPAKLPGVRSWSIETRVPRVPYAPVLAYNSDGRLLAAANMDGIVRIYEPLTGRLAQMVLAEGRPIALAWSPHGRSLAAIVQGQKWLVRLWDGETGRALGSFAIPGNDMVRAFAWSADGRSVLLHAESHWILDVSAGTFRRQPSVPVAWGVYSPDRTRIAGAHLGGEGVFVWAADTGKELKLSDRSGSVDWSSDGKRLACMSRDALRVWEVETGKEILTRKDLASNGRGAVSWSPDGRTLALTHEPGQRARLVEATADAKPLELLDAPHEEMAWSPDGKTIALAESALQIHDAATGQRLRTLFERNNPNPGHFRLSPDGKTVAASIGQTILSSLDTGQVAAVFKEAGEALAWSKDSKWLATTGPDHALLVWSADSKIRRSFLGHRGIITSAACSPDGKTFATTGSDKRVVLWHGDSSQNRIELGPFAGSTDRVFWLPDGRQIGFHEEGVGWRLWDVQRNIPSAIDPKHWDENGCFLIAPDGRSVLTALPNAPFRLRDLATGNDSGKPDSACKWWADGARPAWSSDGRVFALATSQATVELWRGDLRRRLRTLKSTAGYVRNFLGFTPDGKLLTGLAGERLHVWETDTGRLRGILLLGEHNNGLTIAADGHYTGNEQVERGIVVVVQKDDGTQEVLEPADFEKKYGWKNEPDKVHLLQPLPPSPYPLPGQPMGSNALVREPAELPDAVSWTIETVNSRAKVQAVAYRPDGKLLATGGDDGVIRIWDRAEGKLIRMLIGDPVESLAWSADGKLLSSDYKGAVRQWEADTGRPLGRIVEPLKPAMTTARSPDGKQTATTEEHGVGVYLSDAAGKRTHTLSESIGGGWLNAVAWSLDGRSLAIGYIFSPEYSLHVLDAATGRRLALAGTGYIRTGSWSPDGKTFAAIGRDTNVYLLNADSGRDVRKLDGPLNASEALTSTALSWSSNGKRLACGGAASLHVWSVESGKQLWSQDKRSLALAWSPDGRRLAATDNTDKGAVRLWDAESGKLLHQYPLSAEGGLAWSPDGKTLAALPINGRPEGLLIDAETGSVRLKLKDGVSATCSVHWSADAKSFTTVCWPGLLRVWDATDGRVRHTAQVAGALGGVQSAVWSPDSRMFAWSRISEIHLHDATGHPLGVLLPFDVFGQLAVSADGYYRGNARVERAIRMVVQKSDGTSETLTPLEFEQKYGFKNAPEKVRLMD